MGLRFSARNQWEAKIMTREGRVNYYASKNSYFSIFRVSEKWKKQKYQNLWRRDPDAVSESDISLSLFPKDDLKNKKVENTFSRPAGQSERRIRARQLLERVADSERHYHTHTRVVLNRIVKLWMKNWKTHFLARWQRPRSRNPRKMSKSQRQIMRKYYFTSEKLNWSDIFMTKKET